MKFSESEILHGRNEDFTVVFKAAIGTVDADIDVKTFVHPLIDFDEVEKEKEVFLLEENLPLNFVI